MARYSRRNKVTTYEKKQQHGRVNKYFGLYVGIVRDNSDVARLGRLRVHIADLGSDPNDRSTWFTVSYCSPFAGGTNARRNGNEEQSPEDTQTSYGMWFVPPDLNNEVGIMFANGDPARGYWIGCMYQTYMNNMVPGIPAEDNFQSSDRLPTAEYNKKTNEIVRPDEITRPIVRPLTDALAKQGIINDNLRGLTTSSSRRSSISQVYGFLTPGAILDGTTDRRGGGHQFVLDDSPDEEHIRIRTRNGSQIKLDDTNGVIYVINSKGTGWIELSESGHIDVYGADSISARSEKDINLRADRDINMEAGRNVKLRTSKDWKDGEGIESEGQGQGGNIDIESYYGETRQLNKNFTHEILESKKVKVGDGYSVDVGGNHKITSQNFNLGTGNFSLDTDEIQIDTGLFDVTSGDTEFDNSGTASFYGTEVNIGAVTTLQVGSAGVANFGGTTATVGGSSFSISTSSNPAAPGTGAGPSVSVSADDISVEKLETNDKQNVLSDINSDPEYLGNKDREDVKSIVKRFITQEPCVEHENLGDQEGTLNLNFRDLD